MVFDNQLASFPTFGPGYEVSFSYYINSLDHIWRTLIIVGSKGTYDSGPKIPGVYITQGYAGIHVATDREPNEKSNK